MKSPPNNVDKVMTPATIRELLSKIELPEDMTRADLSKVNAEIAERALTRVAVNQSGGLPGLPIFRAGLIRRTIAFFTRRKRTSCN